MFFQSDVEDPSMVNWIAFGLLLDCIGAVLITLPEFGITSIPLIGKLGDSQERHTGLDESLTNSELTPENTGYHELVRVIERHNGLKNDIQPTKLRTTGRFGGSNVVLAVFDDDDHDNVILTTPSILRGWVERDTSRWYIRSGLILLATGFAIQLISQTFLS